MERLDREAEKWLGRLQPPDAGLQADLEKAKNDPVFFAIHFLLFKPYGYQTSILTDISKRIAVRMSRQAGKTTTIAVRAIWFAATHPRTLSLIVAPSLRQSMIMMDRIQTFLYSMTPDQRKTIIAKIQRTVIWFRNGSQMVALPCSPNLLRGYTAHQVLIDEAAFFRDDEIIFYNVLYPMMATTNGTLIASSTPWGSDSVFYKINMNPEISQGWSKHYVPWQACVKPNGPIDPAFIEEVRKVTPIERFRREYDAEFVEDEDSYYPQDLITRCIDPDLALIYESDILASKAIS